MSIRRRRSSVASATDANNHQDQRRTTIHAPTQPIDEGEQETIVKNLRANTIKITNELCNIVVLACAGAAALTVIFPSLIAYVDNATSTRDESKDDHHLHVLYTSESCLSHCLMAYISHVSKFPLRWNPSFDVRTASTHSALYASAVLSTVVQLLFVGYMNWDALGGGGADPVTIGQMIGNLCTLLAALFVAMDSVSTEDVLRKHDGSRYGFKSL